MLYRLSYFPKGLIGYVFIFWFPSTYFVIPAQAGIQTLAAVFPGSPPKLYPAPRGGDDVSIGRETLLAPPFREYLPLPAQGGEKRI